jgi:hypothetical protein
VLATVGVFKAEQLSRPGSDCGVWSFWLSAAYRGRPGHARDRASWNRDRSGRGQDRNGHVSVGRSRQRDWPRLAETGTESADEREFDNDTGELRFWEISEVSAVGLRDPGKEIGALPRFSHAAGVADAPHGWFVPTVTNRGKSAH